jgi:hypothetical protein
MYIPPLELDYKTFFNRKGEMQGARVRQRSSKRLLELRYTNSKYALLAYLVNGR